MRTVRMYNPTHRFDTGDLTPIQSPELAWMVRFRERVTDVAVWDETVYVVAGERLVALTPDGTERWRFRTGDSIRSSPAVVDGTAFFASTDDYVYAVDAATGTERWRWTDPIARFGVRAIPAVVDGTVYVGSLTDRIYALDAESGRKRWAFEAGESMLSPPAVVDGAVYAGSDDHRIYALDAESGRKRWAFATDDRVCCPPTVVDGTVYVGSDDGRMYALDTATGQRRWSYDTAGVTESRGVRSAPAVVDGTVYFTSYDDHFYAVDATTGAEQWRYEANDDAADSAPMVVGDTVYVNGAKLFALDAAAGRLRWRYVPETGSASGVTPVASGDAVYTAGYDMVGEESVLCAVSSASDAEAETRAAGKERSDDETRANEKRRVAEKERVDAEADDPTP